MIWTQSQIRSQLAKWNKRCLIAFAFFEGDHDGEILAQRGSGKGVDLRTFRSSCL